jgi:hypothetical protein
MMHQKLCLKIIRGSRTGEVFTVIPGQRTIVGRSPTATLAIFDPGLSRTHFELQWDGTVCHLVDLGSTNGTCVNGRPLRDGIVRDGDSIEAGDSILRVEIRDAPPEAPSPGRTARHALFVGDEPTIGEDRRAATPEQPTEEPEAEPAAALPIAILESLESRAASTPSPAPEAGSLIEKFLAFRRQDPDTKVYALIDGARSMALATQARLMGHDVYTLFAGDMAVELAHAGPCLARVEPFLPFGPKWVEALGTRAGILVESTADLVALHQHLREIFVVTDEHDQEYFFRYYDPGVLRTYLPTCTPDELATFFGPAKRWIVEDEKGDGLIAYELLEGQVRETRIAAD